MDDTFLNQFFFYFRSEDRRTLCQVCKKWKYVLYQTKYWTDVMPVMNFKELKYDISKRKTYFEHFHNRGFEEICLVGATDADIAEMVASMTSSKPATVKKSLKAVSIR